MNNNLQNNSSNTHNNQIIKKNTSVDYKYICIKKDVFDSSMIYLNYSRLKKNKYIEIIYKSPSVFLEGLFFKTPPIALKDIFIYYKENKYYQSNHQSNHQSNRQVHTYTNSNPTIKLLLNYKEHTQFINILRTIDEYISTYINKHSVEIENDLLTYYNDNRSISSFNYEQIIKFRNNSLTNTVQNSTQNTINSTIEIHMKSYLDNVIIAMLESKIDNTIDDKKYIFTFNISNIYFSNNNNLLPLVKCNKCESV
jgi:hypothetical protein